MGRARSKSLMRGALAAAFLLVAAPVAMPPQAAEAHVTGAVAPYAERLQKARAELLAAITLKDDPSPTARKLVATNIGRHGLEFAELSEIAFFTVADFMNDHDPDVAAEGAWQVGILGEKYNKHSADALAAFRFSDGLLDDTNPARNMNIVRSSIIIGMKSEKLAYAGLGNLMTAVIDSHAEPGEHRNHVVAAAARGIGALGMQYPSMANDALGALERFAKETSDADIVSGIIDGAASIGQHTANKEVKAHARRIISAYKNHPDKNVRWNADFQTDYLDTHRLATAPQP